MQFAWIDRADRRTVYTLPRRKGESRTAYLLRFLEEVKGLGNALLATVANGRVTVRNELRGCYITEQQMKRIKHFSR